MSSTFTKITKSILPPVNSLLAVHGGEKVYLAVYHKDGTFRHPDDVKHYYTDVTHFQIIKK